MKKNEVKMYSLDIFHDMTQTDEEIERDVKIINETNPVGINFDPVYAVTHVLYYTIEERNKAYEYCQERGVRCAIQLSPALVEKKYLKMFEEKEE